MADPDDPATDDVGPLDSPPFGGNEVAAGIAMGTQRLLVDEGWQPIVEFTLPNGRRVDVAALDRKGRFFFIEVKSSVADFRSDHKWTDYIDYCDLFAFAVDPAFPVGILPDDQGVIVADRFGGSILHPPTELKVNAARRKAMTVRFARVAAAKLARAWIEIA